MTQQPGILRASTSIQQQQQQQRHRQNTCDVWHTPSRRQNLRSSTYNSSTVGRRHQKRVGLIRDILTPNKAHLMLLYHIFIRTRYQVPGTQQQQQYTVLTRIILLLLYSYWMQNKIRRIICAYLWYVRVPGGPRFTNNHYSNNNNNNNNNKQHGDWTRKTPPVTTKTPALAHL